MSIISSWLWNASEDRRWSCNFSYKRWKYTYTASIPIFCLLTGIISVNKRSFLWWSMDITIFMNRFWGLDPSIRKKQPNFCFRLRVGLNIFIEMALCIEILNHRISSALVITWRLQISAGQRKQTNKEEHFAELWTISALKLPKETIMITK